MANRVMRGLSVPTLGGLLLACAADATEGTERAASRPSAFSGAKLSEASFAHYGAGVHQGPAVEVGDVLAEPDEYAGRSLRLGGEIVAVCKRKGCWIEVGDRERTVMVRFEDYGFFVPKDCEGKRVVLEGELRIERQSVDEQRHYLEDAGKLEEAKRVTEPKEILSFEASGVAIARSPGSGN